MFFNPNHSFQQLGTDYSVTIPLMPVPNARLVLFNEALAEEVGFDLSESDDLLEQTILKYFAWFKSEDNNDKRRYFFATRYQDAEDKSEGSALGDGRAVWAGEIVRELKNGRFQYLDVVLKGTGVTPLAWFSHPKESHKDGQLGLTEAVHEYIYSLAARENGIRAVGVLAVIQLPFDREVDKEPAAIVIRVGNHLRFAHYCYFSDNSVQLKTIFEYGLKRDLSLPLDSIVTESHVKTYLDLVVRQLADNAAVYFDIHAVHGSPTFGNVTSCGGSIDFATSVYIDAHHGEYSYMSGGVNTLGGDWGQKEQFFNLFSLLVSSLKKSKFEYASVIRPVEYYLAWFNDRFEQTLTKRSLARIGLSQVEIESIPELQKERFYEIVKLLYEVKGVKKIRFKQGRVAMAAFEPRKILAGTAGCIEQFHHTKYLWDKLFKVNRCWGTYKLIHAKPYIEVYKNAVIDIVTTLKVTKKETMRWQEKSQIISLSNRKEPGVDFFYGSERFNASKLVVELIHSATTKYREMSVKANSLSLELVDRGGDLNKL